MLARVGPSVGIVIVEQEMKTEFLGDFCESDGVFQVVGKLRRCVEEPQTNPVVAVVLEYFQSRLSRAVIFENLSVVFGLF